MALLLTVVIPSHNSAPQRLEATLRGLRAQTLAVSEWETVVVDNASSPPLDSALWNEVAPQNLRLIREPALGLTSARRCGLTAARAPLCVLVDDDNVLAPDFLQQAVRLFHEHPRVGAFGGRVQPEFEQRPAPWQREFLPLLALRDLGSEPQFGRSMLSADGTKKVYPACAPIGAGMALRRAAVETWLAEGPSDELPDRRGVELSSAGDNDIVLSVLHSGWEVAYFPELILQHLIPAGRLETAYLGRLNRGIQKSWMQVLAKHGANPWPPIPRWSVPLRQAKAWFTHRVWAGPAGAIRWQGACGHFEGRVSSHQINELNR